jgi:hypothetical protein
MKSFYKALLCVVLLPALSYAQSNYKPGYVVNLKGDTLKGFIDFRDWDLSPTSIKFKTTVADGSSQRFTNKEIVAFNVDGSSFQKYIGPISTDEVKANKISSGRDTSFRIDTVFIQILQKGKNVNLYSYTDDIKTRFYIGEKPDYTVKELGYRLYYNYSGNEVNGQNGGTVNENTYRKQLFALANKYNVLDDNLTESIQKAQYSKSDILNIVSKINNISESEYEQKYADHIKVDFYVGTGLNIYSASGRNNSVIKYPSSTSVRPEFLAGINLIPNPKSDKVEFRGEFLIASYNYSTINMLSISFAPQCIYNFYHAENLKAFLGAGFLLSYYKYDNASFPTKSDNAFMFKAGMKFYNKVELFADMLAFSGGEYVDNDALRTTNIQLGVVYHF